ncbi:Lactosylceramide 4-alpha-galactosyltransferase [Podochytrium sp. JEL0797]|nr:Lactosylceramide 4-alpha-galactosyltransferase [Podochytrium sp. JEL0797]
MKLVRLKYWRVVSVLCVAVLVALQTAAWLRGAPRKDSGAMSESDTFVFDAAPPLFSDDDAALPKTLPAQCAAFLSHASKPNPPPLKPDSKVPHNLFFLHYNKHLDNPRYLCALESAARHNPDHKITLFAKNADSFKQDIKLWLDRIDAHMAERLVIEELNWASGMVGTPLESWWANEVYKDSSWVEQNLGNAFRMGVLWKYGGVYLDLDIVSLNPVGGLGRAISMQDKEWFNNAIFSMEKEDAFAWKMMEEFVDGFKGHIWARNGPRMVTRTYKKYCDKGPIDATVCQSLSVLPTQRFFPIQYEQKTKLFESFEENCDLMGEMAKESIGIHWWNKRVQSTTISSKTVLTVLMKAHCPAVFESFPDAELGIDEHAQVGAPDELTKEDSSLVYNKLKNEQKQDVVAIPLPKEG